jgi:cell division septation protein DedD
MKSRINRPTQSYKFSQKLVLLVTGLVSGAIIVIFLWSKIMIHFAGGGTDRLQNTVSEQAQQSVEPQQGNINRGYINRESKAEVRGDEIQTDTVSELEMLSPPVAGKASSGTLTEADTNNSGTATGSDLETKSTQPTVDVKIQQQEPGRDSGRWAINLVSLQRKIDAEHFLIKANSKGVDAEINQVTVRGKKYWRVQVPGFSSPDEARTKANEVQNMLGLKDVWIVKR